MENKDTRFAIWRAEMVKRQLRQRGIREEAILQAFGSVPREKFVPRSLRDLAYDDRPLPIGAGQTISQPYVVGVMMQLLALKSTDRILEVGAGSGYAAAVLGQIVREVIALERIKELAERAAGLIAALGYDNVQVLHADGTRGWSRRAPYDGILVSAGGPQVPEPLKAQLAVGGRLVMPVGPGPREQVLVIIERLSVQEYRQENLGYVSFVPLIETKEE